MKRTIVIIGGVAVGASAAARLRRLNEEDEIILLERDEYISFANCGLPYYIGDVITERDNLIVQTKESMSERFNIDVRNFSEAIKIDRESKTVHIHNKESDETYQQHYDYVILAPGASPIVPAIDGIKDAKNVFKLRNIPDTDMIKSYLNDNNVKKACVVGAGFIGIEMAENLAHLGVEVTVLDLASQVMTLFDSEMAKLIENALTHSGIDFKLETSINKINQEGKQLELTNGEILDTDMIIMAIGVIPETKLASEAGLELGVTKAIKVNEFNQTSDENIYAGGDAIEVLNYITKQPVKVPLAWPANRQGRLIADHINGIQTPYNGTLGSAVIKVNEYIAATTGLNERAALAAKYNVGVVHIHRTNHAGYYPNSSMITLKLIFDKDTEKVLGAQAFGQEGTEKRIDVIASSIKMNATISDLTDFELCYAPPFSSAKDPVNIAGYVASNVINKDYLPYYIQEVDSLISSGAQFIDTRTTEEYNLGSIETAINVPVDNLRESLQKIDFNKDVYLFCQVGLRGYLAARILKQSGFKKDIYNLSGGYKLYRDNLDVKKKVVISNNSENNSDNQTASHNKCEDVTLKIDACGLQCPGPIIKLKEGIDSLENGCSLKIEASDIGFYEDVKTWVNSTGNQLDSITIDNGKVKAQVTKQDKKININDVQEQRQTMVAFSNDFDKLMATFIIANGALAMGNKVSIFFTFWGLSALRKENFKISNKSFMDKMFAAMLPKGTKKTGLSKMNMLGLGSKMMRLTMKKKNVDTLESLMQQYINNGGKIIACTMSMDVMGISKEELIEGIEYGGVATYIGDAQKSYSNLFI